MLYGSETWVITPHIGRFWGEFHLRGGYRLTGRQPQRGGNGVWVCPLLEEAMSEVVLQEVDT